MQLVVTLSDPKGVDVKTTFDDWYPLLQWLWQLDWKTYQRITIAVKR